MFKTKNFSVRLHSLTISTISACITVILPNTQIVWRKLNLYGVILRDITDKNKYPEILHLWAELNFVQKISKYLSAMSKFIIL